MFRKSPYLLSSFHNIVVACIGGGVMGESIVKSMIKMGHPRKNIIVSDANEDRLSYLRKTYDVSTTNKNSEAAKQSQVILLAVKPQLAQSVCLGIRPNLDKTKPLVLSIATGISLSTLATWLGEKTPMVRAMPNILASVQNGITVTVKNAHVNERHEKITSYVFGAAGDCISVSSEENLNKLTPLVGCGPAYAFLMMEAMEKAAVSLGIESDIAKKIAPQILLGSGMMVKENGVDASILRQQVTTPNGVTESSLRPLLGDNNIFKIFNRAFQDAIIRCEELDVESKQDKPRSKL